MCEVICYQPVDGALLELFQLDSDTFPVVGEHLRYYDMTIVVEHILPMSTEAIAHIAFRFLD